MSEQEWSAGSLEDRYGVPPFSVLDTRQGYWQERRRRWLALGIQSEVGRGADLLTLNNAAASPDRWASKARDRLEGTNAPGYRYGDRMRSGEGRSLQPGHGNARSSYGVYMTSDGETSAALGGGLAAEQARMDLTDAGATTGSQWAAGTSIFDPVVADLMYRWFCPPGGSILDPFAGGSVRGIVAAYQGHPYTGIDLSAAQVAANEGQVGLVPADRPVPRWVVGDSREVLGYMGGEYDMVFTCPPYYDLEVYSDDPRDLSAMDWVQFITSYAEIIRLACERLRDGRFAAIVVGEVRDTRGAYRGLVPLTIQAFRSAGMLFYNEAILVNAVGSGALRANNQMRASRKLVKLHQNVLVFCKGEPPRGWDITEPAPPSDQEELWPTLAAVAAPGAVEAPAAVPVATAADVTPAWGVTPLEGQKAWLAIRERTWSEADPGRRCWTCGSEPDTEYRDGSPSYSCSHP